MVQAPPLIGLADPQYHGPDLVDPAVLGLIEETEFTPEGETPV